MIGMEIMARSLGNPAVRDRHGNTWQYHSQSDRHSKVACWAIMFDLLGSCSLLRRHVLEGKVGFGINHALKDFQQNREKVLDLVVCTPRSAVGDGGSAAQTFSALAEAYSVLLTEAEKLQLKALPIVPVVPVGSVCLALEAKAVMTAHVKALPRLHDELDSSHLTIHGHSDAAIAAALVTVNASSRFVSTSNNKRLISSPEAIVWNHEKQPNAAERAIAKVREIRRRSRAGDHGFDAIGVVVVDFRNDGSSCSIVAEPPAPTVDAIDSYVSLINRISSQYAQKFSAL